MTTIDVILRIGLAFLFGIIIGYQREYHNRPAGIRTHIIVCLGAALIALIQQEIYLQAREFLIQNQDISGLTTGDPTRLIAQVISGIGFLGAGTIIITKRSVTGLTTASSLWATAAIGIALGTGLYEIAGIGFIFLFISLAFTKKYFKLPSLRRLEIKYLHRKTAKEFIEVYFSDRHIEIHDYDFSVDLIDHERVYREVYTINTAKKMDLTKIIEDLMNHENIISIRIVEI